MIDLLSITKQELEELLSQWKEPRFRAAQIMDWLKKGARPEEMGNIPKALREKLAALPFGGVRLIETLRSKKDDTAKMLYELEDGNIIECVLMRYSYGNTLCISTQAGCRMGCAFCASTLNGRVRDLTAGEMLSEVIETEKNFEHGGERKRTVTNIVLMGSGEPLDNYENTLRFLQRATAEDGLRISPRNISLSTCGIVPRIHSLIEEAPHITLCISLHAPNNEIRDRLMPINAKWRMEELLPAAKAYADATGRRVIFEYALVDGVNSSEQCAAELASRLRGINAHVNLIPLNSVKERSLMGVSRAYAHSFEELLKKRGISASVRRELGSDIEGACGQLRNRRMSEKKMRENENENVKANPETNGRAEDDQ